MAVAAPAAGVAGRIRADGRHASRQARSAQRPHRPRGTLRAPAAVHTGRRRAALLVTQAALGAPKGKSAAEPFFAAAKRSLLVLPSSLLTLRVADWPASAASLEAALQAGATGFVLLEDGAGAGPLYETACALQSVLRGRALLLVADRPDVAAAADADGVLLSPAALPTTVARRALPNSRLVLRSLTDLGAVDAAAKDGADGLLLDMSSVVDPRALAAAAARVTVPLLVPLGSLPAAQLQQAGASGVVAQLGAGGGVAGGELAAAMAAMAGLEGGEAAVEETPAPPSAPVAGEAAAPSSVGTAGAALVADERALLGSILDFLASEVPDIPEAALLEEARGSLDDPFLLVVAGEFNSGKSSVINALLGASVLREGVLPTTNEISVLRASPAGQAQAPGQVRTVACADGHFDVFLATPLLRRVSIVDTPGTNVILERQQRLTEEFIPRADLVLFVLSADRPLTQSEVAFLTYIRQWEKRVVFALNKVDTLASPAEVDQLRSFVATNAQQLLGTSGGTGEVFPVSARAALAAKLAVSGQQQQQPLPWGRPPPALLSQPGWRGSGFDALEAFVSRFLGGEGDALHPGEALRLKLLTPLSLAAALLDAAGRCLDAQAGVAAAELAGVAAVRRQLGAYQADMAKDGAIQRARVRDAVRAASQRAERFVDAQLRLQNTRLLASLWRSRQPRGDDASGATPAAAGEDDDGDGLVEAYMATVVASSMEDLRGGVGEHSQWLRRNAQRQVDHYRDVVRARGFGPQGDRRRGDAQQQPLPVGSAVTPVGGLSGRGAAMGPAGQASAVADRFDQGAAALLLADEIRQAALSTAGSAGTALAVGTGLVAVLPTMGEDVLSLALGGVAAYVGLLNLPLRRGEVKAKVARAAESFGGELEAAMEAELQASLAQVAADIAALVAPWEAAAQAEAAAVAAAQARAEVEDAKLRELQQRVLAL